jgi:hypothetical protein
MVIEADIDIDYEVLICYGSIPAHNCKAYCNMRSVSLLTPIVPVYF